MLQKNVTIHCATRSQMLLFSEKPNDFRHVTQVLPRLFPLHILHQPVLRGPSTASQQKHTPALCSPAIKASENGQGRPWRYPRLMGHSAAQCQPSRTPEYRFTSPLFCCRGHASKGMYTTLSDWPMMPLTQWELSLLNARYTQECVSQ